LKKTWRGAVETAADHIFVEFSDQPVTISAPEMIGFDPEPYAPKVIGLVELPDDGIVRYSLHVSPRLKRMVSPGLNDAALTLAMVLHAVVFEVPLLESFPPVAST
jgi:hypothetical protein